MMVSCSAWQLAGQHNIYFMSEKNPSLEDGQQYSSRTAALKFELLT